VRGWLDGATEANRDQATTVKLLMDNEPPYKQGGEDVTRDGLGKVHLATLADNVEMFGLDGKPAEFDRIFKDAGQTWLRLGYIQNNLPVTDAKDDEFVRDYNNEMHVTVPTETVKPEPPKTHVIASKPVKIQFPTGAAALDPNAKTILDDQVVSLAKSTLGSYIHIEGNTDSQGNPEKNVALSKQRAESVRAYLVSKGIDANRLKAIGNGQTKPVADNSTEDGRARNRRTDIVITHQ
jgi:NitT/TauT family transport system substrate-binding protein